ncbi:hypothetical protein IJM16_03395 [Candidatus Saccharibacteria bacterium]|nr:hypothetical protein [Candidatus Saccharibacteria bacterium]
MATAKKVDLSKETKTKATTVEVPAAEEAVVESTPAVTVEAPAMDALTEMVEKYGGDDDTLKYLADLGVESVDDLAELEEDDLVTAGLKLVKARKLLSEVKATKTAAEMPVAAAPVAVPMYSADFSILPAAQSDEALLNSLKIGGVLKVEESIWDSALRVFVANRFGLYSVTEKIANAMDEFANQSDEMVNDRYFALRKQITRRDYGEIFSAIPGLEGDYVTKSRREMFMQRIDKELCPAIWSFYKDLDAWNDGVVSAAGNPAFMMSSLAGALSGARTSLTAASMPPTDVMRDASDALKNAINHTFRGTVAPIAAAMAYDAMEIVKSLNDRSLPAMIGVANREQMLKKLGIGITADYVRMEQNLVRFVLAAIKFSDESPENEISYLSALWQLGRQIQWEKLVGGAVGGVKNIGGHNAL